MTDTTSITVEIPITDSEECLNVGSMLTESFFKKLEYNVNVELDVKSDDASQQTGGGSVSEITLPYALFYRVFSSFSKPFTSKKVSEEVPIAAKWDEPEVVSTKTNKASTSKSYESFYELLEQMRNTIETNPTNVDRAPTYLDAFNFRKTPDVKAASVKEEVLANDVKEESKINENASQTMKLFKITPTEIQDDKSLKKNIEEEEELPIKEEVPSTEELPIKEELPSIEEEVLEKSSPKLSLRQQESKKEIDKCLSIFNKSDGKEYVLRFDIKGKDVKRVESKTEYSHYMDEYRIKREIDIISEGTKRMADIERCEQYIVDGRYIIIGPLVPKQPEEQNPEQVWNRIKNTEAYKKFIRYNII